MKNPPQFSPAGGEGSQYGGYTYTGGQWTQNQTQTPPTNNLIVTGSQPAQQFANDTQQLNNVVGSLPIAPTQPVQPGQEQQEMFQFMETYSDPYTQQLDKLAARSDKATQNLIQTIKAKKAGREATINDEYDRLKQGLFSLGLSTDKMQFTPDLVYGGVMQAENARASKLQELDQDEATAIMEAQEARDNKDFALLKDRMAYIKTIKKSRLDLLKEKYDTMSYEEKIGETQAKQIYDQVQKLSESAKLPFLQEIAKKFDIPLTALTSQISEITRSRNKEKAAGSGASFTPTELKKLEQAGLSGATRQEKLDFLYGDDADKPKTNLYKVPFNAQNIKTFGGKKKIWDLAKALGVTSKKNFTRQDEIDSLFNDPDFVSYVNAMANQGYSIDEIISEQM